MAWTKCSGVFPIEGSRDSEESMAHAFHEIRVLQSFQSLKFVSERKIRSVSLIKCLYYCILWTFRKCPSTLYLAIEIADSERSKYFQETFCHSSSTLPRYKITYTFDTDLRNQRCCCRDQKCGYACWSSHQPSGLCLSFWFCVLIGWLV